MEKYSSKEGKPGQVQYNTNYATDGQHGKLAIFAINRMKTWRSTVCKEERETWQSTVFEVCNESMQRNVKQSMQGTEGKRGEVCEVRLYEKLVVANL